MPPAGYRMGPEYGEQVARINRHAGLCPRNTSGYKGVSYCKARGSWRAVIMVDGAQYELGHFKSAREAAFAYDRAARHWFGSDCTTNADLGLI